MKNISELIKILKNIISSEKSRESYIAEFQRIIWDNDFASNEMEEEILRDLAHDLDYFESNPDVRIEDSSFYGKEKLIQEINVAIAKLS